MYPWMKYYLATKRKELMLDGPTRVNCTKGKNPVSKDYCVTSVI